LFLACVAVILFKGLLLFIPLYLCLSILTYLIFAKDKRAAKNNRWRTSENTLYLLSLTGGWPGALFAQYFLHHKSIKRPFKLILWIMIFMNMSIFTWTLSPSGSGTIKTIIPGVF